MKSWRTSLGGIGSILGGLAIVVKMISTGNYDPALIATAWAAISGGIALLCARDNLVSSEQAGAGITKP